VGPLRRLRPVPAKNVVHVGRFTIRTMLVAVVGCSLTVPAIATDDHAYAHVRSSETGLAALITRAASQSRTFLTLQATIDASNGIVYVEPGNCRHGVKACLTMWMREIGTTRFLRVLVNTRQSEVELAGSIGHELQHVVEVLSHSEVTDGVKMFYLFRRQGPPDENRFETTAALIAGDAIRRELNSH
jgi:hypothetical protein